MTEQLVRDDMVPTSQQQQTQPFDRPSDIKVTNVKNLRDKDINQELYQKDNKQGMTQRTSKLEDLRDTVGSETYRASNLTQSQGIREGQSYGLKDTQLQGQGLTQSTMQGQTQGLTLNSTQGVKEGQVIRDTQTRTLENVSQVTIVDKKLIVEKIAETHFETQYVTKTISVPTPMQSEITMVVAIQETKKVPVTRLVEIVEQVPIKIVEEVVEYKTVPVTKLEEVIEQIPVKKYVTRTEYKKVPVTRLVERTENVNVKRVEERTEYITITAINPINPVPLDTFKEQNSGIIQSSTLTNTSNLKETGSNIRDIGSNLKDGSSNLREVNYQKASQNEYLRNK